jgi:serine/threonine-protein kinase
VRFIGRYALHRAIASGGMATVYLGRLLGPVGFARTVAIKRLHPQFAADPEFVSMFLDEARLAARIAHPNVVPTLDVVTTDGELFLVMEYVQGEPLSTLLKRTSADRTLIPVPIVVSILSDILQGLDAAHKAKSELGLPLHIVHRDVSPQNILVGADGQARLLDFGVARAAGRAQTTQQGQLKGKIRYMPPEQLRGEEIGPSADIYAAGVVLWEALAGGHLFRADHQATLVAAVIRGATYSPSQSLLAGGAVERAHLVAPLDAVVMQALALESTRRFQSARAFARAIEDTVAGERRARVADWLMAVAGTTLHDRAAIVAEIESSTSINLTQAQIEDAVMRTVDPPVRDDRSGSARLGESSASLSLPRQSAGRGAVVLVFVGALVASLAAMAYFVLSRPRPSIAPVSAAVSGPAASTALAAKAPEPVASGAPAPAAKEPAAPSAFAAPASEPPASATPSPPRAHGIGASPRGGAAKKRGDAICDPPFTFDADGIKHYKPECFPSE